MIRQLTVIGAFVALSVSAAGCKAHNVGARSLSAAEEAKEEPAPVADGGRWEVVCQSVESPADKAVYKLTVRGAVSETDEGQSILVSVAKVVGSTLEQISKDEPGHGAISEKGQGFLGFTSGVLTSLYQPSAGSRAHTGVLTLAKLQQVEGLRVGCDVSKLDTGAPSKDSQG
ncbi:MAG: hypothetical protein RL011_19 [Pseudomonadota bacterium]